MTPERMLTVLREHGEDAGSDFNDSDEVNGWFGWTIVHDQLRGPLLRITHTPVDDASGEKASSQEVIADWQLMLIGTSAPAPGAPEDPPPAGETEPST